MGLSKPSISIVGDEASRLRKKYMGSMLISSICQLKVKM